MEALHPRGGDLSLRFGFRVAGFAVRAEMALAPSETATQTHITLTLRG